METKVLANVVLSTSRRGRQKSRKAYFERLAYVWKNGENIPTACRHPLDTGAYLTESESCKWVKDQVIGETFVEWRLQITLIETRWEGTDVHYSTAKVQCR